MVVMHVAHARAFGSGEAEARVDSAIGGEPPLAYIAIPAGFHFTHQYDLLALHIDADAQKVTDVGAGIHDGLCRSGAKPEPGSDIGPLSLDLTLLILPVAIRPVCVVVITDV